MLTVPRLMVSSETVLVVKRQAHGIKQNACVPPADDDVSHRVVRPDDLRVGSLVFLHVGRRATAAEMLRSAGRTLSYTR